MVRAHRRRPGRHVHRPRGDRRPRGRAGGARHLAGHQPRGRHDRRAAQPRGGARGRHAPPPPGWASCSAAIVRGSERDARPASPAPPAASARSSCGGLADRGQTVVGLDLVPSRRASPASWVTVDCADPDAVEAVFAAAAEAGGSTPSCTWPASRPRPRCPTSSTSHVVTTAALLDAMVAHGVTRIVYAGSNHAVGRTPRRRRPADGRRPPAARHVLRGRARSPPRRCSACTSTATASTRCPPGSAASCRSPTTAPAPVHLALARRRGADVRRRADRARPRLRGALRRSPPTPAAGGTSPRPGAGLRPADDAEDVRRPGHRRRRAATRSRPRTSAARSPADAFHRPAARPSRREPAHERPACDRARAWAAEDPDPRTRAELEALVEAAEADDDRGDLARPLRRPAGVRHRRAARCARAGPNRMNRVVVIRAAAGLAAYLRDQAPRRHRRRRLRRPAQLRRLRRGHRRGDGRRRPGRACCCPARCRPRARLRDPAARLRRRRDGDRHAQPAAGQRLQGLPRRRQPDRAAGGRRDLRGDRRGRSPGRRAAAATAGPGSATRSSSPTSTTSAGLVDPDGPRDLVTVYTPLHGVGGDDRRHRDRAGRLPGAARGRPQQAEPDPDFPTVAFPNPEEPGRDGPRDGAGRARSAPTWWSPTTRTRTAARWPCPTRTAGGCCAATRSAPCSATTCSATGDAGRLRQLDRLLVAARRDRRSAPASRTQETLTGFKWIGRVEGLAFGYEEALGYCVAPDLVRDKDGVSAAAAGRGARRTAQGRGPRR